jgi:hypothetical protein
VSSSSSALRPTDFGSVFGQNARSAMAAQEQLLRIGLRATSGNSGPLSKCNFDPKATYMSLRSGHSSYSIADFQRHLGYPPASLSEGRLPSSATRWESVRSTKILEVCATTGKQAIADVYPPATTNRKSATPD